MITEKIHDIMTSDAPRKEKRLHLKLAGLQPGCAARILSNQRYYPIVPGKRLSLNVDDENNTVSIQIEPTVADQIEALMHLYTFGVEIECYNVDARVFADRCVEKHISIANDIDRYNHDDSNNRYKIVSDLSIDGFRGLECVSPVLSHETGYNSLQTVCDTLNRLNARVNRTTGLHVHVGGDITPSQYLNTFVNYHWLENLVTSWLAPSRANNRYCRRLTTKPQILTCTSQNAIVATLGSRYYTVNPFAWSRHGTIEFRQHQGSTEYEKIAMWSRFCVKLVAWSKENRLSATVSSVDDIPFLNDTEKVYFQARKEHFQQSAR